jgi:hypothetical protein
MRKAQDKQASNPHKPAAYGSKSGAVVEPSAHISSAQLKSFPVQSGVNLASVLSASSPIAAQRKIIDGMEQSLLSSAQAEKVANLSSPELDVVSQNQQSETQPDSVSFLAPVQREVSGTVGDDESHLRNELAQPTVDSNPKSASKGDSGSEEDVSPWMKEVGMRLLGRNREKPAAERKSDTDSAGKVDEKAADKVEEKPEKQVADSNTEAPLSFLKDPSKYPKLNKIENSYEKFEESVEADSKAAAAAEKSRAGQATSEKESGSEEDSGFSEYTNGIFTLVKKGYSSCIKLKEAYEEYQLIVEDSEEDASKIEGAKLAFELALSGTGTILSSINQFQSGAGAAPSLAIGAAIPGISLVMSTISLIGRIVTLVQQGKLDFDKTALESQTESILSAVVGDDKKKAEVKQILESEKFRALIVASAEYRQQERDNPKIFEEYKQSLGDPDLQARLKKRYPDNFARIEEIHQNNNIGIDDVGPETQLLLGLGVSRDMLEAIIEDQSLINHLEEVKDKRTTNAQIGIFTDLVNVGADIATLTGAGAAVGAALRGGTAAISSARAGGNAIKFAARGRGAAYFSKGAKGGVFGSSLYDSTNILKNDDAKQERYFHSARLLVINIADHDKRVVDVGKGPSKQQLGAINTSYGWVESKILGTGASVTMIKALANSDQKTGNDLVKYMIDKMKTR